MYFPFLKLKNCKLLNERDLASSCPKKDMVKKTLNSMQDKVQTIAAYILNL